MSDFIEKTQKDLLEFVEDSKNFMTKCTKPTKNGS